MYISNNHILVLIHTKIIKYRLVNYSCHIDQFINSIIHSYFSKSMNLIKVYRLILVTKHNNYLLYLLVNQMSKDIRPYTPYHCLLEREHHNFLKSVLQLKRYSF